MEVQFIRGLNAMDEAKDMKKFAEEHDIELDVHAPYYTNLVSEEEVKTSFERILYTVRLANLMGAKIVVIHPGFYGKYSKAENLKRIIKNIRKLRDWFKKEKNETKLGLETMGRQKVFGSIDEVIEVCQQVRGTVPVIKNLGHIHARDNGCLKTREDFENIFEKVAPLKMGHYLVHVTGVSYEAENELHHIPIKKGDMKVEPLIECILDKNYDVTLISDSPLLEHDALCIQMLVNRILKKRKRRVVEIPVMGKPVEKPVVIVEKDKFMLRRRARELRWFAKWDRRMMKWDESEGEGKGTTMFFTLLMPSKKLVEVR